MVITRWQPLKSFDLWENIPEIEDIKAEMSRLFDIVMYPRGDGTRTPTFRPVYEIIETPDALHVKVELPGLEPKGIEVKATEDRIFICGDRTPEPKTEEGGLVYSELFYGRFERVIPLPVNVLYDQVKADYCHGILYLTVPKSEATKTNVVRKSDRSHVVL